MLASDSRPAPPPSLNSFPTAPHCLPNGGAAAAARPPASRPRPPPRGAGPAPSRGGAAPLLGRRPGVRGGPAGWFPPGSGWGEHRGGDVPPRRTGAWRCVLRCAAGTPCPKSSPKGWSVCSGKASWLVSPRYGFFKFTLLKKSVTKTNKKPSGYGI